MKLFNVCIIAPYNETASFPSSSAEQYEGHGLYAARLIKAINRFCYVNTIANKLDSTQKEKTIYVRRVWKKNPFYVWAIFRAVVKTQANIIHLERFSYTLFGQGLNMLLSPILLILLSITGRKLIVTLPDVISLNQIQDDFISKFHISMNSPRLLRVALLVITRLFGLVADAIVVQTNNDRQILIEEYRIEVEKLHVIPLGEHARLYPITKNQATESLKLTNHFVILYFGHLASYKGIEVLMKAYASMCTGIDKNTVLVVAGGNHIRLKTDYGKELRKLSAKLGISNSVIFTGYVSNDAIPLYLSAADIVVLPYIYYPGSSGSLRYAIQYGKAVVTTTLVAKSEELENGRDIIAVPPADVDSLRQALITLSYDPEKRRSLGKNLQRKNYSIERIARVYVDLYDSLTSDNKLSAIATRT